MTPLEDTDLRLYLQALPADQRHFLHTVPWTGHSCLSPARLLPHL